MHAEDIHSAFDVENAPYPSPIAHCGAVAVGEVVKKKSGAQKCVIQRVKNSAVHVCDKLSGSKVRFVKKSRVWSIAITTMTAPRKKSIDGIRPVETSASFDTVAPAVASDPMAQHLIEVGLSLSRGILNADVEGLYNTNWSLPCEK